ncbi:haloacid dehalogenase type II [Methylobacterium isbiliense]|uniref:(S)-2-haloacid dehalogenase n=1 Tax=Methylobacterium isbiliense TaxID=315478 RepID=A0ABQ4SQ86_9HYPH|nr:haloacid dehalogenase type II [Methylobacterium isbiliense]MDN3626587.1 haloacid dehalogenase type II [Methylobacterium isbiliense]GJE03924.1 (S)-2-haloacid dehalogenase [Methylobacterium isbiliense]
MTRSSTLRPTWLTFDCYGTLIQWDEGLLAAVSQILARHGRAEIAPGRLIAVYDQHEHALEQQPPHRNFRTVSGEALHRAMGEFGLQCGSMDTEILTGSISAMPPFPEVPRTLRRLKEAGFRLCIVSNTDDALIAGNVAQLGPPGTIDRVVTAEQAGAYKPQARIFEHVWQAIGAGRDAICHICASPHLDLVAARDLSFRCVWVDRGTGRQAPQGYQPEAIVRTLDGVLERFASWRWLPDDGSTP